MGSLAPLPDSPLTTPPLTTPPLTTPPLTTSRPHKHKRLLLVVLTLVSAAFLIAAASADLEQLKRQEQQLNKDISQLQRRIRGERSRALGAMRRNMARGTGFWTSTGNTAGLFMQFSSTHGRQRITGAVTSKGAGTKSAATITASQRGMR